MTDQTNDVLELTVAQAIPPKKPALVTTITKEILRAGGRATMTCAGAILGTTAGVMSVGCSGLFAEFINAVAFTKPMAPGVAFAAGAAFNAPFVHHLFNGELPERLTGISHPDGAFTRATKATAYVAGTIGAALTAFALVSSSPDDKTPSRGQDEIFERSPRQMLEAHKRTTIVRSETGPSLTFQG